MEKNLAAKDYNGYYGTNSVLVIKTNIVIEININSSSSAHRREDTDDEETGQNYMRT